MPQSWVLYFPQNLKTNNLGLVLIIARLLAYVGFGLLFLSLIVAVSKYSVGINTFMHISAISLLPHSLYSLFGSSVLASLIAIEETLKTKSNRSVSENEI